jgi:fatty-acyl-CoA synthase
VQDPHWGERPVAFVTTTDPDLDEEILRRHMASLVGEGRLTRMSLPNRYLLIEDLPQTSVGKIDKKALRALWAETEEASTRN